MYESEQWTGTDRGHTTLTVDTQELVSREKALTEWYLGSVCESEQWTYADRGHTTLTADTQEYTGIGQQREGIDCVLVR